MWTEAHIGMIRAGLLAGERLAVIAGRIGPNFMAYHVDEAAWIMLGRDDPEAAAALNRATFYWQQGAGGVRSAVRTVP